MMWWWNDASQGEGWPWGWMLMHGIGSIFFLALIIGGVILLVRFVSSDQPSFRGRDSAAGQILEERYARGEINR
ncbi:MAG: hypothetical protein WBX25_32385, partial [Rhodomicrobium sp.]